MRFQPWALILVPDKSGGLNGSTQHSARTHLALKTRAKNARWVRSAETLTWLGFDRGQSNRSVLPGKALRNQRDGWCCIDRLSWHDLSGVIVQTSGFLPSLASHIASPSQTLLGVQC